jgi:hypothetical protein
VSCCSMGEPAALHRPGSDPPTRTRRMKALNLAGQCFGKLFVVQQAPRRGKKLCWICTCSCGNTCEVTTSQLRTGKTRSCGCLRAEKAATVITHGQARRNSHTRSYRIWRSLLKRCYKPDSPYYARYGERGIEVDPRWFTYEGFYADMGDCPEGMSLERLHNDRNYWRGNCVWATQTTQMRNTSVNRLITWQGRTKCVAEWAELYNITQSLLWQRVYRLGWPVEKALLTPPRRIRSGPKRNCYDD